jgi:hypothetical protein
VVTTLSVLLGVAWVVARRTSNAPADTERNERPDYERIRQLDEVSRRMDPDRIANRDSVEFRCQSLCSAIDICQHARKQMALGMRAPSCPEIDLGVCRANCKEEFAYNPTKSECINYSLMIDVFDECWTTSLGDSEKALCVLPACIRDDKPTAP